MSSQVIEVFFFSTYFCLFVCVCGGSGGYSYDGIGGCGNDCVGDCG